MPAPPALAYVIGAVETFDDAFTRSAAASTRGALVDRMMRASGSDMSWLAPCEGGGASATFSAEAVAECQQRLDALAAEVRGLGERGELVVVASAGDLTCERVR